MVESYGNDYMDKSPKLFGNFTQLPGGQRAVNGFQALSQYDRNRDGVIDRNDAIWSSLRVAVWETDPRSNPVLGDPAVAMNLKPLDELGIESIGLDSAIATRTDANGNTKTRAGQITLNDGATRELAKEFQDGDFGIDLIDAPAQVDYTRTLQGDREWQVFYAPAQLEDGASPLPSGPPMFPGSEWTVTLNQPVNPHDPAWANWRIDQSDGYLVDQYDYLGWTVKTYRLVSATWAYNRTDELGNLITTDAVVAQGDRLFGSAGNDRILAGEGNDEVEAMAGADRVELGNGDDHARGGAGADVLIGGTGRDILFGEAGDDLLYANQELDPMAALTLGQSQSAQDGESGWLDGGDGDDRLFGDAGNDVLLGGAGSDLILGGGGDDHLAGDDSGHAVPQYLRWLAYRVAHDVATDAQGNRTYTYRYATVNEVVRQAGGDDSLYGGAGDDASNNDSKYRDQYKYRKASNDSIWRRTA